MLYTGPLNDFILNSKLHLQYIYITKYNAF